MDHGYSLDPFGLSSRLGREVVIKAVTANILSRVHGHPSRCNIRIHKESCVFHARSRWQQLSINLLGLARLVLLVE